MAVELQDYQRLKRVIRVWGIDSPVTVTITREGIDFKVKGSKLGVSQTWPQIVAACRTPGSAKSFLEGRPVEYLQYVSSQIVKNKIKKLDKESAK